MNWFVILGRIELNQRRKANKSVCEHVQAHCCQMGVKICFVGWLIIHTTLNPVMCSGQKLKTKNWWAVLCTVRVVELLESAPLEEKLPNRWLSISWSSRQYIFRRCSPSGRLCASETAIFGGNDTLLPWIHEGTASYVAVGGRHIGIMRCLGQATSLPVVTDGRIESAMVAWMVA